MINRLLNLEKLATCTLLIFFLDGFSASRSCKVYNIDGSAMYSVTKDSSHTIENIPGDAVKANMIFIKRGKYIMGNNTTEDNDTPEHSVEVADFTFPDLR